MNERVPNIPSRAVPFIMLFISIFGMVLSRELYDNGFLPSYLSFLFFLIILSGVGLVSIREIFRINQKWKDAEE